MALIRLLLPWLAGIFVVITFEWALRAPRTLTWLPALCILGVVGIVRIIVRPSNRTELRNMLLVVATYLVSAWMALFFIPRGIVAHLVAVVSGVLITLYSFAALFFYRYTARYQPFSLDNTITYLGILSVFFFASTLSGLAIFLPYPRWMMTGLISLAGAGVSYLVFWANNVWDRAGITAVVVVGVLVGEWFAVQSMWPTSLFVNGFCVALIFYAIMGVLRSSYLDKLDRDAIIRYASVCISALVVVLATTRWN